MLVFMKNFQEFCIIHNLGFPKDDSVNCLIISSSATVHFELLDFCIAKIIPLGSPALIAKADLQGAFSDCPYPSRRLQIPGFQLERCFLL